MRLWSSLCIGMALVLLAQPSTILAAKPWQFGGFLEAITQVYPSTPNPDDTHALAYGHGQPWVEGGFTEQLSLRASLDVWLDTHNDIDWERWFDLDQRGLQQPAGALRELYIDAKLGKVDLRLGKQEIRWGRADIFNPTDNLTPYDYLNLVSYERLPIPAAKADLYVGDAQFEAVWIPLFTPTRLPLLNQRWFPRLPTSTLAPLGPMGEDVEAAISFRDGASMFPSRTLGNSQWGLRWNQRVPHAEFSLSYFDGFYDIASFRPVATLIQGEAPRPQILVTLNRVYRRMRVLGGDFASQIGPFAIRGEVAYFNHEDPTQRDRVAFVVGLDRTRGDWFVIVEYTDQISTSSRQTSSPQEAELQSSLVFPDEGLRSTFLSRVQWTINSSQSAEIKVALGVRDGALLLQPLYNVALTDSLRLQVGGAFFSGPRTSYLGQYRDNAFLDLKLRYTF
jgi:hypothetical protein